MARYLNTADLIALVGPNRVRQYFDDDVSGELESTDQLIVTQGIGTSTLAETEAVDSILTAAENEADSRMLRSFSISQIDVIAANDEAFRRHVAWVALQFASERRPEFMAEDGRGAFTAQYDRAIRYFENLSRAKSRSKGETVAGKSGRHGGNVNPAATTATSPRFLFSPDRNAPTGHGGF